ncbi:Hypp4289 [Branchiostoma lanceolatum]|uniref:Hypp4289 protein n=1 Tax=Branchiostoma lanceolatum TaxID=7740 RepID=A0A8K0AC86_BRALA|nr:Hypp4289 [Branchiostoma lanceolatum]
MKMGRLELLILMVVCTTVVVVCGQRSGPGPTPAPDGSDDPYPSRNGGMEQQPNGTNNCTDRPEICRYRHELKTWQDRQENNGTDICQPLQSWSIDIAPEPMRFCAGLGGCVVGEDCRQWTGLQCLPNTVFCPAANMCLPTNMSSSCKNGTVMCSSEQNEQFATYAGRHKLYSSWYKNDCVGCSWSHCRQIVGSLDCQHDEIAYCPTLRRCILENETCEGFRSLGAPPEPPAEEPGTDDPRTEETATDTVSESESESEPRREATDEPRREATPTDESRGEEQPTDESEWEPWTEEPWTEEPWTEEPGQDEPSTQEPSTLDPSTAGPSTPSTSKLSTSEPSTPSTSKPSTSEPSTPSTSKLSTSEPSTPSTSKPSTSEPSTPSTSKPSTSEPSTPSTPKPLTSEPSTPEASTPMPSTPKPSTSKPSTPEPSTLQPSTEDPHGNGANPNCTMVQVHVPDDGDCTSLCAKAGDEDGPIGIIKKEDGGGYKLQMCYTNKTVPQPSPEDDQQGAPGDEGARLKDLFKVCDPTAGSAAPRPPPMQCLADPPVLVFRYDKSYALSAAKDRAAKVFTKMNENARWRDMAISGARLSLNQYISFQPSSTTRGTVGIDISVQTGGRPAPGEQQRFTFKVTDNGVNDPPVFKAQREFVAPSVPYDVDPSQWEGVTVAQVMGRFVDDEEQNQVGAAVVLSDLRSSDIGGWSVSPSGDPARFEELSTPSRARRDASQVERLKLLGPNARVKFVPSADNSHWDFIQARQKTVLPIRAWDATAFQGGQVITYDPACPASEECGGSNSISKRKVRVIIEREGCDGRGGSGKKTDNCGVCGGDGTSCQGDCNGDVGGNAEKNKCDKCTGGATGKDASFGVDCAGKCDLYEVNERLGKCLPKGTRVAADCAGDFVLTDRAFINECDICVGGSTGKDKNFGKNECGRCDGTLDCVDCDDVVGGGKQVDDCGECLDPSDPNFNKGCISLSSVNPRILKAGAKATLTVSGAGLQRIVNAKCKIISVSRGTQGELDDVRLKRKDWMDQAFSLTFDAPRAAGEFDLSCDLSGRDGTLVNKALDQENRIIIIPSEGIQITRVQPGNTEIGGEEPIPVTITGQGFVDTGDAWCYAIHKRAAVQVPAEITSATEATCSLPPSEKSVRVKIGVSLEKPGDSKGRGTDDYNGAFFEYRVAAPQLQSARFSDNLALVTVVFDKAIEGPRECRGLFDRASAEKFGSAVCRIVKGNTIVVKLGSEATLRPADQITLKADAITARMSEAGAAALGSVEVLGPETATVPRVELLGPSEVDACTCLRLGARSFNTGGRAVSHSWTVEVDDASVDLTDLEAHLGGLTGDKHARLCKDQGLLESDKQYTFCVTVTNFLGAQSEASCHTVQTLAEVHPFTARIAGSRRRQTIADRRLRLQANVVTPPDSCDQDVDSVTDGLNFRWEVVGSTDFNLDSFTGTLASITEGLKGGETYTVRFIAYSDTHSSEDTVDIVVRSRDLKPAIAGKTITIGSHQNVTLDGSGSRDPDNADGEEFFTWTCLERDTALPCWVEVGGEPAPLPLSDLATTSVRGSMLNPNSWYTFTLTMRKGNRSASTAVELFVSPNEVPQVQVDPVPEKVNLDRRVVINFKLTTTMPDTTVTLECLEQEGYGYVDLEEVTANGKTSLTYPKPAAEQPVNVVILPNSLAPNTRYTFRATAVHRGGEAYADVVVETNAAPSPGDFQVEPAVGTALSDTFTLSAEGWTDDEDDALEYRFGYIGPDDRTVQLRGRNEDSQYEATLPAGIGAENELTLVVDVFDGRRASSRLTFDVTVNPPAEITDDTVDNVKGEIENSLLTGDVDKAMSSVISMVKTVKQVGGNLTEAQQDVVNELKAALTDKITETIPKDEEEVDNALRGLAGTYDADSNMGEEVRTKAKEYIGDLMEEFYRMEDEVSEDNNASARDDGQAKRRRKRNAANVVTTPMTTDQVSDMLLVFDAMLASIDESSPDAVTTKLDFRSTVELGMVGMCRGQSYGGSASVAQSGNVVVRTDLTLFDDIADQQLLASCDGCSGDVTGTPKIRLGEDVAWAYEQWQCVPDSSTVCYGACIGSAQIKFDPLTDPLSSDAIRSDLVLVDLVSPLSDLRTRLAGLRDPLVLDIPATGAMPDGTYTLECRRWAGNAWTTTGCSTNLVPRDVGGVPHVTCSCTFLGGYYALFEGVYVEPTTPAPVTPPPEKNAIEFTFVQNCSVVTSGDQAGFLVTFHDFIADKMRVSATRVRNMALLDVIGVGCICTYDLLEASRPEDTINFYAVDAIAEMMWKRFLGAESPDGVPLDIYRSSLLKDGGMVNPARTAPIQKPATPGEIIAGLVCGLFLFLIMLGLACCFARAMVGKAKVEASPPNSPPNSARREAFVAGGSSPPSGKMETYPRNMEKSSFHV